MKNIHRVYKRPVAATLHRLSNKSTVELWTRYYASATSAIVHGVQHALLTGQPGDRLEIASSNFGYQIAVVVLKVNAKGLNDLKIEFYCIADGN